EVGITKPTLLYYYPSKEALRRAVLDNLVEHWRQTLPRLLEAFTSGHQRFDALTGELVRFFSDDPDRARLLVRELLDDKEGLRQRFSESMRPWILLVAEYVRQGQEVGILHGEVDPESYVMHIVTLVVASIANLDLLASALAPRGIEGAEAKERYLNELFRLARTALFKTTSRKPRASS